MTDTQRTGSTRSRWVRLAISLQVASALGGPAASARTIEVTVTPAQIADGLLPPSGPREWTLCRDCNPLVRVARVTDPVFQIAGGKLRAKGVVRMESPWFGTSMGVTCEATPLLRDGSITLASPSCTPDGLATRGVDVSGLLLGLLAENPSYDLLGYARSGELAPFDADPALDAAHAPSCVTAIDSLSLTDVARIGVRVSCGGGG